MFLNKLIHLNVALQYSTIIRLFNSQPPPPAPRPDVARSIHAGLSSPSCRVYRIVQSAEPRARAIKLRHGVRHRHRSPLTVKTDGTAMQISSEPFPTCDRRYLHAVVPVCAKLRGAASADCLGGGHPRPRSGDGPALSALSEEYAQVKMHSSRAAPPIALALSPQRRRRPRKEAQDTQFEIPE